MSIEEYPLSETQQVVLYDDGAVFLMQDTEVGQFSKEYRSVDLSAESALKLLDILQRHRERLESKAQADSREPTMRQCPYCGQYHMSSSADWFCPLDPHKV